MTDITLNTTHLSNDRSTAVTMLQSLRKTLSLWARRNRERRQLARMSDYELHDIGTTAAVRNVEIAKPFWRA